MLMHGLCICRPPDRLSDSSFSTLAATWRGSQPLREQHLPLAAERSLRRLYSDVVESLVERERELAAIDELLERGGALVVEGRAGIGKTALLDEACRRATALGREVLRARGSELEDGFAFGVVRQLFERRLGTAEGREREVLLAGPAGAAGPLLFGGLADPSVFDTSFAVLHGLYWLTLNLADERLLLIVVDDVHWADPPSLRWLAHLAPRLDGPAVALLIAARPAPVASAGAPIEVLLGEGRAVVRPGVAERDRGRRDRPRRSRRRRV